MVLKFIKTKLQDGKIWSVWDTKCNVEKEWESEKHNA